MGLSVESGVPEWGGHQESLGGHTMQGRGLLPTEAELERIHQVALRVLDEIGVRVEHAEMRDRLAGSGCTIEGERVFFPGELVAATISEIPNSFTLYGRSPETSVEVGLNGTICTNTGIFPNIVDFESGAIRRTTLDDVEATTRVLDALESMHVVYVSLVDATGLGPHMVTLADFAAVLANTTKPLVGPGLTSRAEAEAVVALARAVRGADAERLRRYPLSVPFVCLVTPLYVPKDVVDALIVVAEAGLPLDVLTNPVMGMSAPNTVASTVALGHAEVLALAVMAHAITPGLPILCQNTPSVADMRSMASTTGGPETGLIRQVGVLLAQHLGIPACAHGHTSSARMDPQAADEKALNTLLIASSRPAILGGAGALANVTLTSYETLLLDDERNKAILRILAGVETDEDHLAYDVIADLARMGTVMSHEHTLRYLHSAETWQPDLAVRIGLVGGTLPADSSVDRARAKARELLQTHVVEPLAAAVEDEIGQIMRAYDREVSGSG